MFFLKLSLLTLLVAAPVLLVTAENVITCYGSVQRLRCETGLIRVKSAIYGRTDGSTCSIGRPPSQIQNINCSLKIPLISKRTQIELKSSNSAGKLCACFTFHEATNQKGEWDKIEPESKQGCTEGQCYSFKANINSLVCDGHSMCEFKTDVINSPDPCVGTFKYYNTTYDCIQARATVACEDGYSTLDCGNDVIQIFNANYGRTDNKICSEGLPSSQTTNTNCYAPDTLTSVAIRCNGKSRCTLQASYTIFTDPCFGTSKYLAVSYFCLPRPVQTSVTCEGDNAVLTCGEGVLKIQAANYGRTDSTTCIAGRPVNQITKNDCYATSSLTEVTNRCEGKTSCTVPASNDVFSDPCVYTYKYLTIVYSCVV